MSKIEELQKRVEHLETEVELLKELVKLRNKCPERVVPTYPPTPLQPYYSKEPTPEPPYKITCGGEKMIEKDTWEKMQVGKWHCACCDTYLAPIDSTHVICPKCGLKHRFKNGKIQTKGNMMDNYGE